MPFKHTRLILTALALCLLLVTLNLAPRTVTSVGAATEQPTAVYTQEAAWSTPPAAAPDCKTNGILIVGTDATYPPMESIDPKSGAIVGFDIDLLNAIFKNTPYTLDYHDALFETLFTAVNYGQFDLGHDAITITSERLKTVDFSNPYFLGGQTLLIRAADLTALPKPSALTNHIIGAEANTTSYDLAKTISGVKTVRAYPTIDAGLIGLSNNEIDAFVIDLIAASAAVNTNPALKLKVMPAAKLNVEYYSVAVRKHCSEILNTLNKGLTRIIKSGEYNTIYQAYFGDEAPDVFQPNNTAPTINDALTPTAPATQQP